MKFIVPSRQKLVSFLQNSLTEEWSGKKIRRLLETNVCRVNGRIERFGSVDVNKGDVVEVSIERTNQEGFGKKPHFETLFENEQYLLLNKPGGWVCSEENCRSAFGPHLRLVHRLDKDTTGVLAFSKTPKAYEFLTGLFANREVQKEYLAIVDGIPKAPEGLRETYLCRKRTFEGQTIWGSGPTTGLFASTHWKKLGEGNQSALLRCYPHTGRTHQIRVHLSEIGHPILTDRQYAAKFRSSFSSPRPLLHAHRLRFEDCFAEAPIPNDMKAALGDLEILAIYENYHLS